MARQPLRLQRRHLTALAAATQSILWAQLWEPRLRLRVAITLAELAGESLLQRRRLHGALEPRLLLEALDK